jgi:Tol biopolymer transport system component
MLLKISRLSFYCGAALLFLLNNNTFAGQTTQIDVYQNGRSAHGNGFSRIEKYSQISANGRFVVFLSSDNDLVPGGIDPSSNDYNVYVSDLLTHKIERASFSTNEVFVSGQNIPAFAPSISADGRYVAFESYNGKDDSRNIFIRDLLTHKIEQIGIGSDPILSGDGRYIVFSAAGGIFMHDRVTNKSELVSVTSEGKPINGAFSFPSISANGRYVIFRVDIFTRRIFVRDRLTKKTHLINKGNYADISGNGQYIALFYDKNILVYDQITNKIETITSNIVKKKGSFYEDYGQRPTLSADGRYVTFAWIDDHYKKDIYVYDRKTHKTEQINVGLKSVQGGNASSFNSSISADGRYVAFDYDIEGPMNIFVRDRLLNTKQKADLKIVVTKKPAQLKQNSSGNYLFTITNNGPNVADNINLTHLVSNGITISFKPSQGNCSVSPAETICSLGKLAVGKSLTLNSVIKASEGKIKNITQQFNINAAPVDIILNNNSISISTPIKN